MDESDEFTQILDHYDDGVGSRDAETEVVRLQVCPIGQERSFYTGRCILEPRPGWKRNSMTNRLVKTYGTRTAAVDQVNSTRDPVVVDPSEE